MRNKNTTSDNRQSTDWQEEKTKFTTRPSVWVLMGFVLWIGFFIGAMILHAVAK